jgi:hypothetical protein
MRHEGRVVMRREGQWVRRLADGMQARGSLRAARPGEGPWIRDRMRWEHRATRFGEAAALRGVDSAQRSVGDQAGYGWTGMVSGYCGRSRERTGRELGPGWSHVTAGPGPVEESQMWCDFVREGSVTRTTWRGGEGACISWVGYG